MKQPSTKVLLVGPILCHPPLRRKLLVLVLGTDHLPAQFAHGYAIDCQGTA